MNRSKFDLEAFFPRLRRGHSLGTRPAKKVVNGDTVTYVPRRVRCSEDLCVMNNPKSRVQHIGQAENIKDWEEERRTKGLLFKMRLRYEQAWRFQAAPKAA